MEPTETVKVLLALPSAGGVTVAGLKVQPVPAGRLAQERATGLENPALEATVQVALPLVPCGTVRLDGLHPSGVNGRFVPGACGGGGRAETERPLASQR